MQNIKNKSVIIFILLFMAKLSLAQISLPGDNFVDGWKKSAKERSFTKETLFNYIDGGAELFLEYGFVILSIQSYKKEKDELTLNLYQMENADAALGIYLKKCGRETPLAEIKARNSFDRYQLTFVKGRYFLQIDNFSGKESLAAVMTSLARQTLAAIPKGKESTLLNILPEKNLLRGSERIIRGPFAMKPVYTFGKGDVLQLEGKIFAAAADYKDEKGVAFTRLIIPYPDAKRAKKAYRNLIENLDSYLTIINKQEDGFSFMDYKKKYGVVGIQDNVIEIKVHLLNM